MHFDPSWHPEGTECEVALRQRLSAAWTNLDWMIIGGSGIGTPLVEAGEHSLGLTIQHNIPLADLGLPAPSVAGHGSSLVFGELAGDDGRIVRVCVQTGRIHPYEGHSAAVVTAPLGAVLRLGVKQLLLTCAVGGINPKLRTGTIVSLRDQVALFGPTPLRGSAFVDCSDIYASALRAKLRALELSSRPGDRADSSRPGDRADSSRPGDRADSDPGLPEVVYAHARGPQYETPAEVAALRVLGGDVVGMSTTYEAILAAAHRVPTCGLGVVTNAAGSEALSHLEVQQESARARGRLSKLIRALLTA
jgi:purine-nucleoside phosphorylase